uniref:glutathione transferase n=1 Tax=Monopterus albus TaxID=43700 RepID=A0A3Q3IFM6_MONAL
LLFASLRSCRDHVQPGRGRLQCAERPAGGGHEQPDPLTGCRVQTEEQGLLFIWWFLLISPFLVSLHGSRPAGGSVSGPHVAALPGGAHISQLRRNPAQSPHRGSAESDAILKYLATRYNVPEHWYPRQPERRARVDEYTAWHHSNTRPHAAKVFMLEVLLPAQSGSQVDEGRLIRALSQLDDTLDKLETMFLRRQAFLCGDDITVADLLAICELMQPLGGGRDVLQGRPQLQRWRSRVQSAISDAFDRAHAILYAVRDRHKAKL